MVSLWEVTDRNPSANALDLLDGQGTKIFCTEPAAGGQLAGDLCLIDAVGGRETLEFNEQIGQRQRRNANNRQRDESIPQGGPVRSSGLRVGPEIRQWPLLF
jgi:hypothetical protein